MSLFLSVIVLLRRRPPVGGLSYQVHVVKYNYLSAIQCAVKALDYISRYSEGVCVVG